jgi:MFS family permease
MTKSEANWTGVLFGLSLAVLAAYHQFKLPPVLPLFLESYGYGATLAGAFMSIYAIAGLTLSLGFGSVLQGPHLTTYLHLAFAAFILGSLATLAWPDVGWVMLIARGLEGVGFAVLAVAGPALCIARAGQTGLPIAAALVATWIPAGALLSGAIAATVSDTGNWQMLWWAGILLTLMMSTWVRWLSRRRSDFRLTLDDEKVPKANKTAVTEPDTDDAWSGRAQIITAALFALWSCQLFGFMTWLPQYFVSVHNFELGNAVMSYSLPLVTIGVFNLVAAPILRAGMPVAMLLAIALLGQAAVWFLVPIADGLSGLAMLVIYGTFAGLTPTCLFALPATILGVQQAGSRAFGILMTGRNLGVLTGPLLLGAALQSAGGWKRAAITFGLLTVCATVGAAGLHWRMTIKQVV